MWMKNGIYKANENARISEIALYFVKISLVSRFRKVILIVRANNNTRHSIGISVRVNRNRKAAIRSIRYCHLVGFLELTILISTASTAMKRNVAIEYGRASCEK